MIWWFQVHMQDYNAKHAQMKILPRYKVKTEGEAVSTDACTHTHLYPYMYIIIIIIIMRLLKALAA